MKRFAATLLFAGFFLSTSNGFAICNNCEPNPTSSTYQSTITQRPKTYNSRRERDFDEGGGGGGKPTPAPPVFGSSSYTYAIPILHLPGRNGLDVDLTLLYNSRVWTRDMTANAMTFNADRDWPAVGFRMGYGYIEKSASDNSYILTEGNGAKHQLAFTSTNNYNSNDSTYINYNPSISLLIFKNGTRMTYEPFYINGANSTTLFRPTQIKDTNGNFITISYVSQTEQSISAITDTLGRVITFTYVSGNLTSISDGFHQYGFGWNTAYPLKYAFTGATVKDTVATGTNITVLTSCTYPNGTGYTFGYGDWGMVNTINAVAAPVAPAPFPGVTRASQSYDFPAATTAQADSPTYSNQTIFDGINTAVWNYGNTKAGNLISTVTVTDPVTPNGPQKKSVTTLSTAGDFTQGLVTQSQIIDVTNNKTLRTSVNAWANTGGPKLTSVTSTNDAGQQSKVTYTYDANGNVATVSEFDYGLAPVRTTATTYLNSANYTTQHILDRPTQVLVKNAAGNVMARTDFAYDGSALASQASLTTHDDTNYPATFLTRGNVTQVTRYSNASAGSGIIQRNFTYDMLGNLLTADLDCCNKKTWTFDSTTSYAFPISITRGSSPSLTTSATYDTHFRLATSTDENGKSVTNTYDDANHTDRLITVTRNTDGATFTTTYDDASLHPVTTTSSSLNSAVQKSYVELSGSTNRLRRDLYNGSSLISSVVSYVDALGRTYKASNPFGPSDTEIDSTTTFDALNRPLTITPPSGGSSQFAYAGNSVQATDPAGKTRKNFSDGLGRLVRVDEPGWGNGTPSHGSVTISGAERYYGHWTVCNLKCRQLGGESTFIIDGYDSGTVTLTVNGSASTTVTYGQGSTAASVASALAQAINNDTNQLVNASSSGAVINLTARAANASSNYPVSVSSATDDSVHFSGPSFTGTSATMTGGTDPTSPGAPSLTTPMSTGYVYDTLNNLTLVDQPPQTRTYAYDSLGRVTSAKTPETNQLATTFTYDDPGSGQVKTRTDARGVVTTYTYDGLNRLATVAYSDGTPGVTYTYGTSSSANNNGRLISATDSSGTPAWSTIYGYNNLGQTTGVAKTISGAIYNIGYAYNPAGELASITYPSGRVVNQSYDPIGRLQSIADATNNYLTITPTSDYNAAGQLTHFAYGNGVAADFGYNDHLQVSSIRYSKTGQPDLLNLAYNYGAANNGQIASISDNVDSTHTMSYTYDAWSRLSTAQAGPTGTETWKYSYNYDRFGNRRNQNVIAGTGTQVLLTIDQTTNRISDAGNSYDAAGNMTADSMHSYAYDAENRMKTVDSTAAAYSYDDGVRIKKVAGGTTTVYIFSGAKVIAEYSGTSTLTLSKEYIYSGSKLLATVADRVVTYSHADHLSGRVESSSTGAVTRTYGSLPFGESWYETGAASKLKFTSYERDTESGLDYAMARQDSSRLGRFMSPDPLAGSLGDPQSLNRYAYVGNDPVNLVDPSGMDFTLVCADILCLGGSTGGGDFTFIRDVWALSDQERGAIQDSLNNFLFGRGSTGGEGRSTLGGPRPVKEPTDAIKKAKEFAAKDKCADFLKSVGQAALDNFYAAEHEKMDSAAQGYRDSLSASSVTSALDQASYTFSSDRTGVVNGTTYVINADTHGTSVLAGNATIELYSGFSNAGGKTQGQILLHEGLHLVTGRGDQDLAQAAGVPEKDRQNSSSASEHFQQKLNEKCK